MLEKRLVWLIDQQQWPRAALRAELMECGYEAVGYANLADAAADFRLGALPAPQVIVIELRDLAPAAPEDVRILATAAIPLLLLGGRLEFNSDLSRQFGPAARLQRPFTLGSVASQVTKLLALTGDKDTI